MFMEVSSGVAVDHAITGMHLVAVFWQDVYHSGRDPDLMEGVIWSQQAGQLKGVQEICIICLPVTWRHQRWCQFIHKSGGPLDQCCKFWQEWWS